MEVNLFHTEWRFARPGRIANNDSIISDLTCKGFKRNNLFGCVNKSIEKFYHCGKKKPTVETAGANDCLLYE